MGKRISRTTIEVTKGEAHHVVNGLRQLLTGIEILGYIMPSETKCTKKNLAALTSELSGLIDRFDSITFDKE